MKKFKIKFKQANMRLDRFLSGEYGGLSRSHLQKLIRNGEVLVNGKIQTSHYGLKENDLVVVRAMEVKKKVEGKKAEAVPEIEIIDDTDEYLVVNKPAGLIVHGAGHIKETTLIDVLLKKYPKIKKVGEDPERPGIMHRLDKDVSGLMVIAKTQDSFDSLKKQFQERTMYKKYVGLVHGAMIHESGTINFNIERSSSGHKMAAKPATHRGAKNPEGKIAITEFRATRKFYNFTLLDIKIKTGRTHQIRAHMAAYGYPIVGDTLYGTSRTKLLNKKLDIKRNFLVAAELSFKTLGGKTMDYKIGLPADLKEFLTKIK